MRATLLGPFDLQNDSGESLPLAGSRLRDLVARLALAGGKPVSTSALAEAVWAGSPPSDLANALQTLVSRARRALGGPGCVEQSAAGYRLAVTPDDVDALRFERLAAEGACEEALALWRGPALDGLGEFAVPYALRLHELKLEATVTWLARELDSGRAAAHVAELEALAAQDPLNEKVAALLMRALAATGRQADALAAHEALRGRLADELGIDPGPELRAAHLAVVRGELPAGGAPARPAARPGGRAAPRSNLRTPLTSFVGREDELSRLRAALGAYRLVTLVGPGGAGKTRLALEVAGHVAAGGKDAAPDGVWMAELASVTDASDVPHAVLGSIGLRESRLLLDGTQRVSTRDAQTRLLEGLADARALLVLDNCEHLIDACAHLADMLLAHSPRLRIVATSREPLGITGESLLVVPPLGHDPATRLFRDRAVAVSPGFRLDAATTPLVADIVRRLDGLPLAIELAAARLRTLPLAEVSRRLDDRFRLLTGGSRTALPRHRTLRAVVEWSWDLLTQAERLLAERFSVFPAGATPEAAAEVCGYDKLDGEDIDELLSSLVDKSLLEPVAGGRRLRMLETIREYGSEQVAARGVHGGPELGDLRRRHATYYSDLMARAAPRLLTRDQVTWLPLLRADRDNILAALRYWCDAAEADRAITLAMTMCTLALLLGNHADIADLMDQVLGVPGDADPDLRTVSEALYTVSRAMRLESREQGDARVPGTAGGSPAGQLPGQPSLDDRVAALDIVKYPVAGLLRCAYAVFAGSGERLRRYVDEAMASEDEWLAAAAWVFTALIAENDGDLDTLRTASAEALARFRALGERWGLSGALRTTGGIRLLDGDLDGAAAAFAEAGRVLEEMGSRDDEAFLKMRLADIAIRKGDMAAAREFYEDAQLVADTEGSLGDQAMAAIWGAMFEATLGRATSARPLLAAAERRLAQVGPSHPVRQHMDAVMAAAAVMIAINDEDLPAAADRARAAHDAAVRSRDMPLLALASGSIVRLALALGRHERAAEMLGAVSVVRGGEDPTDPMTVRLAASLTAALGERRYASAYARGRQLDRAAAIAHLDPAALLLPAPAPGSQPPDSLHPAPPHTPLF